MSVWGYMIDHWGMLVLLIGICVALYSDIQLERRMIFRISLTSILLFIYSVSCYMEHYLGNQPEYSIFRTILSAFNYSLVTFILVNIIMILYPEQKLYLYFPALLNASLCFISIPTGIVFYITEENHFQRGMLGYLTYFITGLYLFYLFINMFKKSRIQKKDLPLPLYMSLTAVICLIAPLFTYADTLHWFNITITTDVLLYYVFLLQQFTKRDPLTKLLNRQSYYNDAEKYEENITAIVAMDMNGLKEINDKEGHVAGDTALKALADCFWRAAQNRHSVYRIGGDEYVILCANSTEDDVKSLIGNINQEVAKTPYTCSIGYAMRSDDCTIDKLYQQADARLYEDKKLFYQNTGKDRRRRR